MFTGERSTVLKNEKNRTVIEVGGYEDSVEAKVEEATIEKAAKKAWDASKIEVRNVAAEVLEEFETQGHRPTLVLLAGKGNKALEVSASSQRKALSTELIQEVETAGLNHLVREDVKVVLRGELAAWALTTLGDRTGDPNFDLVRQRVVAEDFEDRRVVIRRSGGAPTRELLRRLTQAGIYAPAVEATVRKRNGA